MKARRNTSDSYQSPKPESTNTRMTKRRTRDVIQSLGRRKGLYSRMGAFYPLWGMCSEESIAVQGSSPDAEGTAGLGTARPTSLVKIDGDSPLIG